MTADKLAAANAGLSTFDNVLQKVGRTDCVVSLDKQPTVAPRDKISSEREWVTWDSIHTALGQLEAEALRGIPLGSLDGIISRLWQSGRVIAFNKSKVRSVTFVALKRPSDSEGA
jgi:hypothetical protein